MNLSRRKWLAFLGGAAVGAGGTYSYLCNEPMTPAPLREGYVLCDLHTHPSSNTNIGDLITLLASPGLVGLAQRPGSKAIFTYEMAVDLLTSDNVLKKDFKEITMGQLAKFREGYFARTEEFSAKVHHFLAIGWEGNYFPNYDDPFTAIKEVHTQGGLVVLNHPYSVESKGMFPFEIPSLQQQEMINKLCLKVDLLEVHNAHNINLYLPGLDNMRKAEVLAEELAATRCHDPTRTTGPPGISGSDTHRDLDQIKLCGIYVREKYLAGMNQFKDALKLGRFELYGTADEGPYVSRGSFVKGLFLLKD